MELSDREAIELLAERVAARIAVKLIAEHVRTCPLKWKIIAAIAMAGAGAGIGSVKLVSALIGA